jgi:hypothetical protein
VTVVSGLLNGTFLTVRITMLTAEVNIVATRRLWPSSFSLITEQPPDASRQAHSDGGEGLRVPPGRERQR